MVNYLTEYNCVLPSSFIIAVDQTRRANVCCWNGKEEKMVGILLSAAAFLAVGYQLMGCQLGTTLVILRIKFNSKKTFCIAIHYDK